MTIGRGAPLDYDVQSITREREERERCHGVVPTSALVVAWVEGGWCAGLVTRALVQRQHEARVACLTRGAVGACPAARQTGCRVACA